ncbi:unnamed protein product, partial [Staurois parvus]
MALGRNGLTIRGDQRVNCEHYRRRVNSTVLSPVSSCTLLCMALNIRGMQSSV